MTRYPKAPAAGVAIDRLAWMSGWWSSKKDGERLEEVWSSPDAGVMIGMFRWIHGDAPSLYEFLVLKSGLAGLELHIKHFASDLAGWEQKDATTAFDLVRVEDREAVFASRAEENSGWVVYRVAEDGWLEFEEASEGEASGPTLLLRFEPVGRPSGGRLGA